MKFIDPQMLESEDKLVRWIKTYTHILFDEEIHWRNSHINADLVGKDTKDNPVIVEVKLWYDDCTASITGFFSIYLLIISTNSNKLQFSFP